MYKCEVSKITHNLSPLHPHLIYEGDCLKKNK